MKNILSYDKTKNQTFSIYRKIFLIAQNVKKYYNEANLDRQKVTSCILPIYIFIPDFPGPPAGIATRLIWTCGPGTKALP